MRKQMLAGVAAVAVVAVGLVILRQQDASSRLSEQAGPRQGLVEQDVSGGSGATVEDGPAAGRELPPAGDPDVQALTTIANAELGLEERYAAVGGIGSHLSDDEVARVLDLLSDTTLDEAVRNDLLTTLERQASPVGRLAPTLISLYRDQRQSAKWRDYCLQHMAEADALEPAHRDELRGLLSEVAVGGGTDAATAMLSLERIAERDPAVLPSLQKAALAAVERHADDPEAAVVALQVAASQGSAEAVQTARDLLADPKAPTRLRMSAVATLGQSGDASDVARLEALTTDSDGRVARAAKLNLTALRQRTSM